VGHAILPFTKSTKAGRRQFATVLFGIGKTDGSRRWRIDPCRHRREHAVPARPHSRGLLGALTAL